MVLIFT